MGHLSAPHPALNKLMPSTARSWPLDWPPPGLGPPAALKGNLGKREEAGEGIREGEGSSPGKTLRKPNARGAGGRSGPALSEYEALGRGRGTSPARGSLGALGREDSVRAAALFSVPLYLQHFPPCFVGSRSLRRTAAGQQGR